MLLRKIDDLGPIACPEADAGMVFVIRSTLELGEPAKLHSWQNVTVSPAALSLDEYRLLPRFHLCAEVAR
jgi:hypothetical protein